MRIDKYLWCIRFFKTRNQAGTACKKGHVLVNGQQAKPSREILPMDMIRVRKDQINYEIKVLDIPESRVGAKWVSIYMEDQTPKEAFENMDLLKYSKDYYRKKGAGRPTKKDRRDLEDYIDDFE